MFFTKKKFQKATNEYSFDSFYALWGSTGRGLLRTAKIQEYRQKLWEAYKTKKHKTPGKDDEQFDLENEAALTNWINQVAEIPIDVALVLAKCLINYVTYRNTTPLKQYKYLVGLEVEREAFETIANISEIVFDYEEDADAYENYLRQHASEIITNEFSDEEENLEYRITRGRIKYVN